MFLRAVDEFISRDFLLVGLRRADAFTAVKSEAGQSLSLPQDIVSLLRCARRPASWAQS